jgi:hypothetical protein
MWHGRQNLNPIMMDCKEACGSGSVAVSLRDEITVYCYETSLETNSGAQHVQRRCEKPSLGQALDQGKGRQAGRGGLVAVGWMGGQSTLDQFGLFTFLIQKKCSFKCSSYCLGKGWHGNERIRVAASPSDVLVEVTEVQEIEYSAKNPWMRGGQTW